VRGTLLAYALKKHVPAYETERAKTRDKVEDKYFSALDIDTQHDFVSGAWAFTEWIDKQGWQGRKLVRIQHLQIIIKFKDRKNYKLRLMPGLKPF
jgi:hypothetical protein